ncbi:CwfJ domain protein, partial [Aureobasidium melanogenum]
MVSKIAVIGAVNGQVSAVFGKLSALHAKNAFAFAIITGDLFADPVNPSAEEAAQLKDLLEGKIEIALPVYFALGKRELPREVQEKLSANAGELCSNLYFLGRRTTVKTSEGVKIVALGGAHMDAVSDKSLITEFSPSHTPEDVKVLRGANTADILVTSEWPAEIRTGSNAPYTGEEAVSQQGVADLCTVLKPRYHFSFSEGFLEREPFFHAQGEDDSGYQITRFISLASYGNAAKQKWIYAFTLDTAVAPTATVPSGVTASPLSFTKKRKAVESQTQSFSRFSGGSGDGGGRQRGRNKRARPNPNPSECFFCLSNPNIATHLISSIGDSAYLTTAKGPLPTPKTFPALGFPGHMLIIPLEHAPTLASIQDQDSKKATIAEMHRYRLALQSMLTKRSEDAAEADKLGAVTWEISRLGGIHIHWQFMPVPQDIIKKGLVEAGFKVEAENQSYPAFESSSVSTDVAAEGDCFKATIWDGAEEKTMVLPLDSSFRFDLQFGRRVLAKLLGLESRSHWQDCDQSEAEESIDVEAFKAAFAPFDFSLEA